MKKLSLIFGCLSLLSLISISSCSKSGRVSYNNYEAEEAGYEAPRLQSRSFTASAKNSKMMLADAAVAESASYDYASDNAVSSPSVPANGTNGTQVVEKKLVKTGNLTIETDDLASSVKAVEAWAASFSGYIQNSSCSERNAWYTVKIPSESFEKAMDSCGEIGKVLNHGINTEDVTEQFYDLESRIGNKKIMKDKLEGYLKQAKDIKDLLQIERELNTVISNIDSMEGSLKRLSNQISYSTISINIVLPSNHTESGFIFPDFKNGISEFFRLIIDFFVGFFRVVLLIVIFGLPIIAAVAFFFWLLFGKCGLLIKLFKKLKK